MGRGRMGNSGGGSSRGFSGGGSRGSSFGGGRRVGRSHSRTTVIVGGHHHGSGSPWVGIVVGAMFILTAVFIVIGGISSLITSPQYLPVIAECVLNEESGGYYYTTYEYTIDGKDYRERSMQSWEFPEEDQFVTIYYLKSDPSKIYEEAPETDKGGSVVMIFAGLMCGGMGTLALVLCLKQLKRENVSSVNRYSSNSIPQDTSKKCAYCGAKYNKNSDSCPKCGASRLD